MIDGKEYSYLIQYLLLKTDNICFSEEVFNKIKYKNTASQELINTTLEGNQNNINILKERDMLALEVRNLKKILSIYKYESINSNNSKEGYVDYDHENSNWLAEAAGTDDPETMNDVYWNLD